MRLKNSKFELLFEDYYTRYQTGGLSSQDLVKFRKSALSHPFIKNSTPDFANRVKQLMESDLNLVVGAVKMIRPGTQYGLQTTALGYLVDVVQETAPGLWGQAVTVPIEVLERIETGINRPSIPDSLVRKDRVDIKPKTAPVNKRDKEGNPTNSKDSERNLAG